MNDEILAGLSRYQTRVSLLASRSVRWSRTLTILYGKLERIKSQCRITERELCDILEEYIEECESMGMSEQRANLIWLQRKIFDNYNDIF